MVGSSATSRCSAPASLSSSDLVAGRIATGSSGSGSTHGSTTAGESLLLSVSVVSACRSLATTHRSPAIASGLGRSVSPSG